MIKTETNTMTILELCDLISDDVDNIESTAFLVDHCYCGDLSSLGIEYCEWVEDDTMIEVVLPNHHQYFELLEDVADCSIAV